MSAIHITLPVRPGQAHLDSVRCRAEVGLGYGAITALPTLTVVQSEHSREFWTLIITMPECDRPFWLGFVAGCDFCRSNPAIWS